VSNLPPALYEWEQQALIGENRAEVIATICEALRDKTGVLDLSLVAFRSIPPIEGLGFHTLQISSNSLLDNPPDLTRCGALKSLTLNLNGLSVPPELGHLKGSLTNLSLFGNRFGQLPTDFKELSLLKDIDLSANPLEATPDLSAFSELVNVRLSNCDLTQAPSIQGLPKLKLLDLSCNAIQVPPDLGDCPVEQLYLSNNQLLAVPDVRGRRIEALDLTRNEITDLPNWLWEDPPIASAAESIINLARNPFTEESYNRLLVERIAGFHVIYDRAQPPIQGDEWIEYSLSAESMTWLNAAVGMDPVVLQRLTTRWFEIQRTEADRTAPLAKLLHDLRGSQEFKESESTRRDLIERTVSVLEGLAYNDELRQRAYVEAIDGLAGCEDRATACLGDIAAAVYADQIKENPAAVLVFARQLHCLEVLNAMASDHVRAKLAQGVPMDALEVPLALRVKFANIPTLAAKLPPGQPKVMRFEALAKITPQDFELMQERLIEADEDTPRVVEFLAENHIWKAWLDRNPEVASAIAYLDSSVRQEEERKLNDLKKASSKAFTSNTHMKLMNELAKNYKKSVHDLYAALSAACLRGLLPQALKRLAESGNPQALMHAHKDGWTAESVQALESPPPVTIDEGAGASIASLTDAVRNIAQAHWKNARLSARPRFGELISQIALPGGAGVVAQAQGVQGIPERIGDQTVNEIVHRVLMNPTAQKYARSGKGAEYRKGESESFDLLIEEVTRRIVGLEIQARVARVQRDAREARVSEIIESTRRTEIDSRGDDTSAEVAANTTAPTQGTSQSTRTVVTERSRDARRVAQTE